MGSKIWRIVGAAFVGMLGFGAVIPMLPVYLHEQAGASTFVTGLMIKLSSAFALLGRLFAGKTADRKGRRIALLLGMVLCAAAGASILPALGSGLRHGGAFCMVSAKASSSPPRWRGRVDLGAGQPARAGTRLSLLRHLGRTFSRTSHRADSRNHDVRSCVPDRFFPRGNGHRIRDGRRAAASPARTLALVSAFVLLPGILLGLGNVTYAAMAGFLILLLLHRGHGATWAFSAFAVAVLFGRAVFGGLPDRMGPRRSLFAGLCVVFAVGLIVILAGHSSSFDALAASLIGLGYSFPWPALASVVVGQVPIGERAAALGALNAFSRSFSSRQLPLSPRRSSGILGTEQRPF